jgi:gluconokinase
MNPYVLALDIGTSSTRTALFNAQGERIMTTTAQQAYALDVTPDGGAELAPHRLFTAVEHCLLSTLRHVVRGPILGIGVSCFWHSLLGLNKAGQPITPIYTWADARCRPQAAQLRSRLKEPAVHARTGCLLRTSFWPAKLLWLKATQPKLVAQVARWVSPAEWLQEVFCGEALCSYSLASGTGCFHPSQLRWDTAMLKHCGLSPGKLNRLSDDSLPLTPQTHQSFPLLREARWFPSLGDGAASNLGSGAMTPGLAALNFGTSAALRVVRPARSGGKVAFGLFRYCVDANRSLIGGAISNAGNLRAWAVRELGEPKEMPADPKHGLTVLPFLAAERAPSWPEEIPAAIVGLTYATTAQEIAQALIEATYHRLAQIATLVQAECQEPLRFIVSGGIQKSATGLQRLSNVLGLHLYASTEPEASLRGGAVLALEKMGFQPPAPKLGSVIRPQKKAAQAYARAREKQVALESKMKG